MSLYDFSFTQTNRQSMTFMESMQRTRFLVSFWWRVYISSTMIVVQKGVARVYIVLIDSTRARCSATSVASGAWVEVQNYLGESVVWKPTSIVNLDDPLLQTNDSSVWMNVKSLCLIAKGRLTSKVSLNFCLRHGSITLKMSKCLGWWVSLLVHLGPMIIMTPGC